MVERDVTYTFTLKGLQARNLTQIMIEIGEIEMGDVGKKDKKNKEQKKKPKLTIKEKRKLKHEKKKGDNTGIL